MKHFSKFLLAAFCIGVFASASHAGERIYGPFPVTLKAYYGTAKNSVKYTGQIARHTLHESLKKLAGKGNGSPNAELQARMTSYFQGKDAGRAIVSPASKDGFPVKQSGVDELSKGTNLAAKSYGGVVSGWPNNMNGAEVIQFWIDKASQADGGYDMRHGYQYAQLISKFLMGAVFYNQAVDKYLDEYMSAEKKPNDKPYKGGGVPYSGKEHSWDEAFGYFGAPAHTLTLTAQQVYDIAKQKSKALKAADRDGDGKVNLLSEMVFQPAYYAAGFDKKGSTNYLHTIVEAFYEGRMLIIEADGKKLTDAQRTKLMSYVSTIEKAWQQTLAEAVFKYAGSVYKDMKKLETVLDSGGNPDKALKTLVKHWGELKGFSLSLQAGRGNLGDTALRLNRLIGYGPVLANQSQVLGINSDGSYRKGEGTPSGEYMLHMLKVQKLMIDKFGVKARANDQLADMKALADKVSSGGSAEND